MKSKQFKMRKFTSLYITISFLIMLVSGIILFIAPPGRIAHWSYWAIAGLTKTQWQGIHIIFTFLFVIAGILHIIYNWKPIIHYLSTKSSGKVNLSKELIISILFSIFVFVGTVYEIQPFGIVLDFGEEMTDSWADESNEPPVPHAENLTIAEFASVVNLTTAQLTKQLAIKGYEITDTLITMEELSVRYNVTPNTFYNVLSSKTENESKQSFNQGSGFGRKNLSEVLSANNISWEEGVEILKKSGILVEKNIRLKDIADQNDVSPIEIINALGI